MNGDSMGVVAVIPIKPPSQGGIRNWRDALEFVLAGATAVAIGTQLFVDPDAPNIITRDLREYLAERGVPAFRDLIGQVQLDREA